MDGDSPFSCPVPPEPVGVPSLAGSRSSRYKCALIPRGTGSLPARGAARTWSDGAVYATSRCSSGGVTRRSCGPRRRTGSACAPCARSSSRSAARRPASGRATSLLQILLRLLRRPEQEQGQGLTGPEREAVCRRMDTWRTPLAGNAAVHVAFLRTKEADYPGTCRAFIGHLALTIF